ncbi:gliding motility-associated ABC transporter ATP-binding subunit GldA [Thermophagus sp. OGC60D27]|uniref:gliding motility-associated ABC transporter ATP-binding subunit GldA n=1 Tax=Thermophagus sp. OGC60D27 TaxID=3458415 RepID=UPI0040376864
MSIVVSGVTKNYGNQKALDNVSFEVPDGQIVGFLGPNGAGKSTMMKIITGYLPVTSGTVSVCGLEVGKNNSEVRKKIGYLPEHNPLYVDMYIMEYLMFVADIYKLSEKKKRVEEIIELTGLTAERQKKIGSLSKGYRQRVGLAQALLPDPDVLILDEPTTGLDPNQIVEVRNLIRHLGKEKTVLLSTHIMQEVQAICERVIIINRGQLVANEEASDLEQRLKHNQQKVFVEYDREVAPEKINAIAGVVSVYPRGNGWLVTAKANQDVRPALFKLAVDNDLIMLTLNVEHESLEEVFHSLTS